MSSLHDIKKDREKKKNSTWHRFWAWLLQPAKPSKPEKIKPLSLQELHKLKKQHDRMAK